MKTIISYVILYLILLSYQSHSQFVDVVDRKSINNDQSYKSIERNENSLMETNSRVLHMNNGIKVIEKCQKKRNQGSLVSESSSKVSYVGCIICSIKEFQGVDSSTNTGFLSSFRGKKGTISSIASITSITSISTATTTKQAIETPNKKAFDDIYKNNVWGREGGGSGSGSDANYAVGAAHILRLVIFKYGLSSLLDAPCGAVSSSWTRNLILTLSVEIPCFQYYGVDVVSDVINTNIKAYSSYDWASFRQVDLSSPSAQLPKGYDIILSRDALQHLPYKYIAGVMNTYCSSDAKYLLVGSYLDINDKNKDIESPGGCFEINLLVAPFHFPPPIEAFNERSKLPHESKDIFPTKYLLLYDLPTLCQDEKVRLFTKQFS